MAPTPITCGAKLSDGGKCNELTTVTKASYVYDRKPNVGGIRDYALREIHYNAVCPKCGDRTIVDKLGA